MIACQLAAVACPQSNEAGHGPGLVLHGGSAYFMKNHNRMMIGIGTPKSHRMMERIGSP